MNINSKIKNITVSGRIGAGATTLATRLSQELSWELLEGGALFEKYHNEIKADETEVGKRPDKLDLDYEEMVKKMLREGSNQIIQSHLAGYDAQGISGVFKILVLCEEDGVDKIDIRIDRLVNRKGVSIDEAKREVKDRELGNLEKFRRLYADNDPNWVYWDKKYYDLVVNTFDHNPDQTLELVLKALEV